MGAGHHVVRAFEVGRGRLPPPHPQARPLSVTATTILDTFQIVKNLRAAGMLEEQATAVTTASKDAQEFDLLTPALKSDLRDVELRLTAKCGSASHQDLGRHRIIVSIALT